MPGLAVLDELSFLEPKNEVLRCLGQRHRNNALTKGIRSDAVRLDSGALFFTKDKTFIVQQGLPDLPMAPPLGELASERETERVRRVPALYSGAQSSSRCQ